MAWIGLAGVVGWLEQPRVGLVHRARAGQRAEVGRALLAPVLADAPGHPAEEDRVDHDGRHRRQQQQHGLAGFAVPVDPPLPVFSLLLPHAHTVAGRRSRLHTHASQDA